MLRIFNMPINSSIYIEGTRTKWRKKNSHPNFCLQSAFYLYFKHLKTNLFRMLHAQGQISSVYYTRKQTYFYLKRLSNWPLKYIKRLSTWRLSPILCSKAVFIKFVSSCFKRFSNLRLISLCILSACQIYTVIMTLKLKVNKSVYIASRTYRFCWQYAIILAWKTSSSLLNQLNR